MARCRKCCREAFNSRFCTQCLSAWSQMRLKAFEHCSFLYGKLSPENHEQFKKKMKKLEKLWRKSPEDFEKYILDNS
jgi:hypothetical protein